jgi:hypothetical protein
MWQTTNKENWWKDHFVHEDTWTDVKGNPLTPSHSLLPFRKAPKNPGHDVFWSSDDCRDWAEAFGYTYLRQRIIRHPEGHNELQSFPIDLKKTDPADLTLYYNQFYSWMDNSGREIHQPTNPLVKQFYPLDLSSVEALWGEKTSHLERPTVQRGHPSTLTPNYPTPHPVNPDYRHVEDLCDRTDNDLKLRQWNVLITCQK